MAKTELESRAREPLPRVLPMIPKEGKREGGEWEFPHNMKEWISEFLWSGVRAVAYAETERVELVRDTQRRITSYFPELKAGLEHLAKGHSVILDGVIVFNLGRKEEKKIAEKRADKELPQVTPKDNPLLCRFFVFDILYLDGEDLRGRPLVERKRRMRRVLSRAFQNKFGILVTPYWRATKTGVREAAEQAGFKGFVLKKKKGTYVQRGEALDKWIAYKFSQEAAAKT